MSTSSPRFLTTAVILLLLINTGLVVYLVLDRNQSHRHNTGRNRLDTSALLAKEINLTAAQEQQHRPGHGEEAGGQTGALSGHDAQRLPLLPQFFLNRTHKSRKAP